MVQLPTIDVTSAQATRIQNAFGGAEQYRAWLRQAIRGYVKIAERQALVAKFEADIAASEATVDTDLGSI